MNEFKESLKTIKILSNDHNHFTNKCCICFDEVDDNDIIAINIDRLSGLYPKLYTEKDYACKACLVKQGIIK